MSCDKTRELLSLYIDGMLDKEQSDGIKRHIDVCGECRDEYVKLKEMIELIRSIPEEPVPQGFDARLRAALDRAAKPEAKKRNMYMRLRKLSVVAAVFAIGLLSILVYNDMEHKDKLLFSGNADMDQQMSATEKDEAGRTADGIPGSEAPGADDSAALPEVGYRSAAEAADAETPERNAASDASQKTVPQASAEPSMGGNGAAAANEMRSGEEALVRDAAEAVDMSAQEAADLHAAKAASTAAEEPARSIRPTQAEPEEASAIQDVIVTPDASSPSSAGGQTPDASSPTSAGGQTSDASSPTSVGGQTSGNSSPTSAGGQTSGGSSASGGGQMPGSSSSSGGSGGGSPSIGGGQAAGGEAAPSPEAEKIVPGGSEASDKILKEALKGWDYDISAVAWIDGKYHYYVYVRRNGAGVYVGREIEIICNENEGSVSIVT
ncbi:MAG: zf-HC2 domain-containing protein [Clostridiales Family XIII bacterium]|nr:zf-HC2 domain-containing protein [Clostridiales Family XIII bacterium]